MKKFKNVASWSKSIYKVELLEKEYECDNNEYMVRVSTSNWENSWKYRSIEEAEAKAVHEIEFCKSVLELDRGSN